METQPAGTKRSVSPLLTLGILCFPAIFVGFLLRKGHSTVARAIGFGWAGLLIVISLSWTPPHADALKPKPSSPKVQQMTASPPANVGAETKIISQRPALSAEAQQLKALYEELRNFRDDPQFRRVGFSPCCRFSNWKARVEELDRTSGEALFKELRVPAGELTQLGLEYALHDGRSTELAKTFAARLDFALSPTSPKSAGGGRAISEGWWCRNVDTWFASMEAAEAGEYAKSSNMRTPPACPHVRPNETTGPELDRRAYKFSTGDGEAVFVKVKVKGGDTLWAPLEEIEFR